MGRIKVTMDAIDVIMFIGVPGVIIVSTLIVAGYYIFRRYKERRAKA